MGSTSRREQLYVFNEVNWFWLLPALAALVVFLPRPETNLPRRRCGGGFRSCCSASGCWERACTSTRSVTSMISLRPEQLLRQCSGAGGAMQTRMTDFVAAPPQALFTATLFLPLFVTVPPPSWVRAAFFYLSALNLVAFAIRLLLQPDSRLVLQLGLLSFAAMVASVPIDFAPVVVTIRTNKSGRLGGTGLRDSRHDPIAQSQGRNAGLIGGDDCWRSFASGDIRMAFIGRRKRALFISCCTVCAGRMRSTKGAAGVRMFVAASWVVHAFIWTRDGAMFTQSLVVAGVILLVWVIRGLILRRWQPSRFRSLLVWWLCVVRPTL